MELWVDVVDVSLDRWVVESLCRELEVRLNSGIHQKLFPDDRSSSRPTVQV